MKENEGEEMRTSAGGGVPSKVEVVPGRVDGGEDAGGGVEGRVPTHPEAIAVQRTGGHALPTVPALLDDRVARSGEQIRQQDRLLPDVHQKSAHLLSALRSKFSSCSDSLNAQM